MLYEPLQPWQTRLINLHAGSFGDELVCSLYIADIIALEGLGVLAESRVHVYEALSYSWGRAELDSSILCNGDKIWVPSSMVDALHFLRYNDRSRWLWCDGLCINQADNSEKAMQVRNMLQIFQKAERVLAWLGNEEQDTAIAFDAINLRLRLLEADGENEEHSFRGSRFQWEATDQLSTTEPSLNESRPPTSQSVPREARSRDHDEVSACLNLKQKNRIQKRRAVRERLKDQLQRASRGRDLTRQEICPKHKTRRSRCCSPVNHKLPHQAIPAVRKLIARSWFSRTWVRQECYAAQEIILCCGSHTALFNDLFDFVRRQDLLSGALNSLYYYCRSTEYDRMLSNQSLSIGQDTDRWRPLLPPTSVFLRVLQMGRYFDATDDRDRIYGLVGMVEDLQSRNNSTPPTIKSTSPGFPIDYTKPVKEVYQDVIKYIINNDRNLNCINYFGVRRSTGDFPSWVMDWRHPRACSEPFIRTNEDRIRRLQNPKSDEPEIIPAPIQNLDELGELKLTGSVLGELDTPEGKIQTDRYIALGRDLKPWQSLARDPYTALRYKVHSRLLYRSHPDDDDLDTSSLPAHLRLAELWERGDYVVCPLRSHTGKVFRNYSLTLLHVRDFIVPKTAKAGDLVALMTGTAVPYILRRVTDGRDAFTLVGACWYREGGRYDEQEVENHFVADSVLSVDDGPFQDFVIV